MKPAIVILLLALVIVLSVSCKSAPPPKESVKEGAEKKVAEEKKRRGETIPDYTIDWRQIADLAGKTEYDPYITDIVWQRLNWRAYITGEASTELIADWEREFRWDKKMRDWEAKRKPAGGEGAPEEKPEEGK